MPGRLSAFITPAKSLDQAVERVALAERLGYESVFTTHIAGRDGMMTLAAYAAGTSTIKIGTGVLPAFPRHPVALAIEAATLQEMSGNRVILGLGMAHQITMETWYGIDMAKPLSRFKEYVSIVQSILTTGAVEHSGDFYQSKFAFMDYTPPPAPQIMTASLSPNSLRFAGASTAGTILWSCMPTYIRETVVPTIAEGAKSVGRDPAEVDIVAAVPCALADDVQAARDILRKTFFVYLTLPFYRAVIDGAGYGDELKAFDEALGAGDMPGAYAAMSDRMLDEFSGIGDEAAVRGAIARYREAGVTLPGVGTISLPKEVGPGVEATLEAAMGA